MKSRSSICIAAVTACAALAIPVGLAAQDKQVRNDHHSYHHYQLVDLGTLGGPNSFVTNPLTNNVNGRGLVLAEAETAISDPYSPNCFVSDCALVHSLLLNGSSTTDLGALPGVNNSTPIWINAHGVAAGYSENSVIDPMTGFPETRAVIWANGQIQDLGTFGGNVSYANAINNRGQVVGAALNAIADPFGDSFLPFAFVFPVATQAHAFSWTQRSAIRDLGTLGSGLDSQAFLVNESGQVAGVSFTSSSPNSNNGPACLANVPTQDPFLWENGRIIDLGTLGGHCGWPRGLNNAGAVIGDSTPVGDGLGLPFLWTKQTGMQALSTTAAGSLGGEAYAINDAGQVVGYGQNSNEAFALIWENGSVRRLGNLAGANCTIANSINSRGQVIGYSGPGFPQGDCTGRAVIWENNGPPVDLNFLVPPNSPLQLYEAITINDRGEIVGNGLLSNGDQHAFLAIPCDENHLGIEGCDYSMVDSSVVARVSPLPVTEHPAALPPGVLNRFDSRRGQRNQGLRTGTVPDQKMEPRPSRVTYDWLSDRLGDFRCGPRGCRHYGYCEVANGQLDGECVSHSFQFCDIKPSANCPIGQPASPTLDSCGSFGSDQVALNYPCSF
jgi:probable HAF family extracellular repeat protein